MCAKSGALRAYDPAAADGLWIPSHSVCLNCAKLWRPFCDSRPSTALYLRARTPRPLQLAGVAVRAFPNPLCASDVLYLEGGSAPTLHGSFCRTKAAPTAMQFFSPKKKPPCKKKYRGRYRKPRLSSAFWLLKPKPKKIHPTRDQYTTWRVCRPCYDTQVASASEGLPPHPAPPLPPTY